jgi:peptide/nickel transport system substrate-binding protein
MQFEQRIARRELLKRAGMAGGAITAAQLGLMGVPRIASVAAQQIPAGGRGNGKLVASMNANPQGLDPQVSSNTESFQAMLAIYETLVEYDPATDTFYAQLATEMPDMSNPLSYTFALRQGVTFHDGTPLTAADVKYTFDFVIQKGPESPAYGLYGVLESVNAIDDHTVQFNLKQPYGLFIPYLSSIMGGIVKSGARESQDLIKSPVGAGCGPFEFVEWVEGDHISFKRYEGYFRPELPALAELEYRVLVEETLRTTQLLSGDIQFSDDPLKKDVEMLMQDENLTGAVGLSEKVNYVLLNNVNELTSNVNFRRALSFAIDREAILDGLFHNYGEVAHGPMRPNSSYFDPKAKEIMYYDPEKAKAELELSGFAGREFDFLTQNDPSLMEEATFIQDMWRQVGINVNVVPLEKSAFYDQMLPGETGWVAGLTDWSSSVLSPDYMIKLVYTSTGSYQRASYSGVDALVEQLTATADPAQQQALISEIQLKMAEDVPSIWIAWLAWTPIWRKTVTGFHIAPTYYEYFDAVSVSE